MEDRGGNACWAKVIRTKVYLGAAFLLMKRHAHSLARGEKTSSLHAYSTLGLFIMRLSKKQQDTNESVV